jgi:regulator of sigma E protease
VPFVLAFLGFAALIILHEAGHFAAAKAVGMRVERFSLFFGPLLVKFRHGETEYGIGPIPLGGYVKITGMNPNEDIPPEALPRAYFNQPVWKRVVVILAGPAVNLLIAFALITGIFMSLGQAVASNKVEDLVAPASQYLRPGDAIVAVDGRRGLSVAQITNQIRLHRCAGAQTEGCVATTPVHLVVSRDGRLLSYTIYPRYSDQVKAVRVGFTFGVGVVPLGVVSAAGDSLSEMWYVTHSTVTTVARIFEPKVRSQLHGVVGGYTITEESFATSARQALWVLALISLSLGVINLFPFLPLDGGHVFWAVAEKVRGKRIPFAVMERAGVVGFALIVLLFVIGLSNDVSALTGPGFPLR